MVLEEAGGGAAWFLQQQAGRLLILPCLQPSLASFPPVCKRCGAHATIASTLPVGEADSVSAMPNYDRGTVGPSEQVGPSLRRSGEGVSPKMSIVTQEVCLFNLKRLLTGIQVCENAMHLVVPIVVRWREDRGSFRHNRRHTIYGVFRPHVRSPKPLREADRRAMETADAARSRAVVFRAVQCRAVGQPAISRR